MTTNKKIRRANYEGISAAIDRIRRAWSVDYRKWYVDQKRPGKDPLTGKPLERRLMAHLMCEPDADHAQWKNLRNSLPVEEWFSAYSLFMSLQSDTNLYFGVNSVLGWRESDIYMFFFHGNESAFPPPPEDKQVDRVLEYMLRHLGRWMCSIEINPYAQGWRQAEIFEQAMRKGYFNFLETNVEKISDEVIRLLCRIEVAYRHPERFNSAIAPVVGSLYKSLTSRTHGTGLADFYELVVSENIARFMEEYAAGGKFTLCVRYGTPEILEAALPLLSPESRYPYSADASVRRATCLSRADSQGSRTSVRLLMALWECGFSPSDVSRVDDRTLCIELPIPLEYTHAFGSMIYLCGDMTNFRKNVVSSKDIIEEDWENAKPASAILLTQPLVGNWRVAAIGTGSDYGEVVRGELSEVDRIVESGKSSNVFLPRLLENHIDRIRSFGRSNISCRTKW